MCVVVVVIVVEMEMLSKEHRSEVGGEIEAFVNHSIGTLTISLKGKVKNGGDCKTPDIFEGQEEEWRG